MNRNLWIVVAIVVIAIIAGSYYYSALQPTGIAQPSASPKVLARGISGPGTAVTVTCPTPQRLAFTVTPSAQGQLFAIGNANYNVRFAKFTTVSYQGTLSFSGTPAFGPVIFITDSSDPGYINGNSATPAGLQTSSSGGNANARWLYKTSSTSTFWTTTTTRPDWTYNSAEPPTQIGAVASTFQPGVNIGENTAAGRKPLGIFITAPAMNSIDVVIYDLNIVQTGFITRRGSMLQYSSSSATVNYAVTPACGAGYDCISGVCQSVLPNVRTA